MTISVEELTSLGERFDEDPTKSFSLPAKAYLRPEFLDLEKEEVFYKSWQYVSHIESLKNPGDYVTIDLQGRPIVALRDRDGELQAFYNVCRHRGHELLCGTGNTKAIVCPYHAWSYDLKGKLFSVRYANKVQDFNMDDFTLMPVQVEEFCSMVFVNLDPDASSMAEQTGDLEKEILGYADDLHTLTHAKRLTYTIKANWKSVVDNFLECYHCSVAHKDFVTLIDIDNYRVKTHGIYSSHISPAGKTENSAYSTEDAAVQDHAVWWLWPNTCLLRYPGAPNWMVWPFIPIDAQTTNEDFDFFFESKEPLPS